MEKSKEQKKGKVVTLPKNPQEYSYRGNEEVTMSAAVFMMLYRANEVALREAMTAVYPTRTEWISSATGIPVEGVLTHEEKLSGNFREVMSIEKTYSQENVQEETAAWAVPEIIQVKDALIQVHNVMVEKGVAVRMSELQAEAKENAAKEMQPPVAEEVVVENKPTSKE